MCLSAVGPAFAEPDIRARSEQSHQLAPRSIRRRCRQPALIETLPRRGYRFLAPVETSGIREPETPGRNRLVLVQPDLPHRVEDNLSTATAPRRQVLPWAIAGVIAVMAVFGYWKPWRAPPIVPDRPFFAVGPGRWPRRVLAARDFARRHANRLRFERGLGHSAPRPNKE
jgi:hypothetical protein